MTLTLPKREHLSVTGPEDALEYYYRPLTAWFYRHRLTMAIDLLQSCKDGRFLEVGCGSGILLKELAERCRLLAAVDIHERLGAVRRMLALEGLDAHAATLYRASAEQLPFRDETFDAVICLSVLEHFVDPGPPIEEIARVSRTDANIILGFPAKNPVTDRLFGMLGYRASDIHPAGDVQILDAASRHLRLEAVTQWPRIGLRLFWVGRFRKR